MSLACLSLLHLANEQATPCPTSDAVMFGGVIAAFARLTKAFPDRENGGCELRLDRTLSTDLLRKCVKMRANCVLVQIACKNCCSQQSYVVMKAVRGMDWRDDTERDFLFISRAGTSRILLMT